MIQTHNLMIIASAAPNKTFVTKLNLMNFFSKVYANEELSSNGRLYHKMCAKCKDCSRQLEFNTVYDGKDKVSTISIKTLGTNALKSSYFQLLLL